MNIIIAGAGRVGLAVASVVTRNGQATFMETDTARAEAAQNMKNVKVILNDASNPVELMQAIDRFSPEAVVAAVDRDSTNIFICSTVKHRHPAIRTIAAIENNDYLSDSGNIGVDAHIAPRQITADRMVRCALLENVISLSEIKGMSLFEAVFRVDRGQAIAGKHVMNLGLTDGVVVAIYRSGQTITDVYAEEIHTDDRILVVGTEKMIGEFNRTVGVEHEVRNLTMIGASDLCIEIAGQILKKGNRYAVKILDSDLSRCSKAARALRGAVVVNGPVNDPVFLRSENVDRSDALLALSSIDDSNLMVCMNAQRFGVPKILSQYTSEDYGDLLKYSGIEGALGFNSVVVNETSFNILNLSADTDNTFVLDSPGECLFAVTVDKSVRFHNRFVGDVYFPPGISLVAIRRDRNVFFPDISTRLQLGDRVMFYTAKFDTSVISGMIGRPFMGM